MKDNVIVITSVYINSNASLLDLSINSVVTQLREGDELIIFKDGEVDGDVQEVVSKYISCDRLAVACLSSQKNIGLGAVLNHLIDVVNRGVIVKHDSDDVWPCGRREVIENFFKNKEVLKRVYTGDVVYFSGIDSIDEIHSVKKCNTKSIFLQRFNHSNFILDNRDGTLGKWFPSYSSEFELREDWWLDLSLRAGFIGVQKIPGNFIYMYMDSDTWKRRYNKKVLVSEVMILFSLFRMKRPYYFFISLARVVLYVMKGLGVRVFRL